MIRLGFATTLALIIAQEGPSGDSLIGTLTQFGVAAPFAILALYGLKEYRAENKRLLGLVMEAIPVLAEANRMASETAKTLGEVGDMLHQTSVNQGDLASLRRMVEDYQRRLPGT